MGSYRMALGLGTALGLAVFASAALAAKPADIVLYDGKVITVDKAFSIKKAVAVKDGKIIAVGGDEIAKAYDAPVKVDLHGKTLMPGFMDTHVHLMAVPPRGIQPDKARSIADLQAMIRAKAKELGPGEWITGSGWDEAQLAEKRNPNRYDLDAAAPDNPVVLTRAGGHSSVGNSLALKLAKIDRNTPELTDGLIERDKTGEPNGVIRERSDLYTLLVPPDSPQTLRPNLVAAIKNLLPLGITSYMEALSTIDDGPDLSGGVTAGIRTHTFGEMQTIYRLYGDQLPRVTLYLHYPGAARLKAFPYHTGWGDDRFRIGPIGETPVDGGFTGPTAWTLEDYKNQPGFRGRGFYTTASSTRWCTPAPSSAGSSGCTPSATPPSSPPSRPTIAS